MKTKRWQRRTARTLLILALTLLSLFYIGTEPIDQSPYFTTDYYKETSKALETAIEERVDVSGPMLAGFAKMDIAPKIGDNGLGEDGFPVKLAGYSDGQFAVGIHDSIYAKAIALEIGGQQVVLVTSDLLLMPETVVSIVASNLQDKIDRNRIFFGATHTHSAPGHYAPGFVGELSTGEFHQNRVAWLAERFTRLINTALADLRPAQMATDHFQRPDLIRNRIIGDTGRLNPNMDLVAFQRDDGKKAVIGVFSAHPTSIATWNNLISGDYPGYYQRWLEAHGYDLALFFAGTMGSQSNQGQGERFEKVRYIGEALAKEASDRLANVITDSLTQMSLIAAPVDIPELQAFYISQNRRLAPWLGHKLIPNGNRALIQGLRLNRLVWITMPYELSAEYGIDLKNALTSAGYESILTSFNGQYLGYIVPSKYYRYDTYEARLMGWYGPGMGDYLMELNFTLADALVKKRL